MVIVARGKNSRMQDGRSMRCLSALAAANPQTKWAPLDQYQSRKEPVSIHSILWTSLFSAQSRMTLIFWLRKQAAEHAVDGNK